MLKQGEEGAIYDIDKCYALIDFKTHPRKRWVDMEAHGKSVEFGRVEFVWNQLLENVKSTRN